MKLNKRNQKKTKVYIVPTLYGFLYGAIVIFLTIASTVFSSTDLLLSCAVLVTFGVACMHQTHRNLLPIEITNVETQSGFAGEKIPWRFRMSNPAKTASYSIQIMDEIVDVPAREGAPKNISVLGAKRGHFHIKEVKISSTYPLGLFYAWKWAEVDLNYYIYPPLGSKASVLTLFQDRSSELDSREDFLGHREFQPGDSAHHIDWKVQARKQKLLVKLFESPHHGAEVLDWNRLPDDDLELKLTFLARAVFDCHRVQKPFAMILPKTRVEIGKGTEHYETCLELLATFGKEPNESPT